MERMKKMKIKHEKELKKEKEEALIQKIQKFSMTSDIQNTDKAILQQVSDMFINTQFKFGYVINNGCGSAGVAYGNGYNNWMVREIYISFIKKEVRYLLSPILSRDRIVIRKFEKLSDIQVPKTIEEFDSIVGWV